MRIRVVKLPTVSEQLDEMARERSRRVNPSPEVEPVTSLTRKPGKPQSRAH